MLWREINFGWRNMKIQLRSSYEIAYAKYLDNKKIEWYYEETTFNLGNTTYTPDFYIPEANTYIEIKCYWRKDALEKFKLFKEMYPDIKIEVIGKIILEELGII